VTVEEERLVGEGGLELALPQGQRKQLESKGYLGKEVIFGIRPEDISSRLLAQETYPAATVTAEVLVSELLGSETMLYVKQGENEFTARVDARDAHQPGESVQLTFNVAKGHFFDTKTKQAIR
ncbi:TOBE domain-containing protein, partial [Streptococcus devriesei]